MNDGPWQMQGCEPGRGGGLAASSWLALMRCMPRLKLMVIAGSGVGGVVVLLVVVMSAMIVVAAGEDDDGGVRDGQENDCDDDDDDYDDCS